MRTKARAVDVLDDQVPPVVVLSRCDTCFTNTVRYTIALRHTQIAANVADVLWLLGLE